MTNPKPNDQKGNFVWYELMTSDLESATAFYSKVVGWTLSEFPGGRTRYVIANAAHGPVGGLMPIPPEAKANGMPPVWVGYVGVDNVDQAAKNLKHAGGHIDRAPDDIPNVGRFAMVTDPQGAMFVLFTPKDPQNAASGHTMRDGGVGWHELMTTDMPKAFDFYASQFGWVKSTAMDMGPMGTYQLFKPANDSPDMGGMMTDTQSPKPYWLFYFVVADIDAAMKRVTDQKGKVLMGPMEVPGGAWIIQATDPQGALFALVGMRKGASA
ncbi:MAG: VOC family protein [Hyphomicrobiaceae bacterium]